MEEKKSKEEALQVFHNNMVAHYENIIQERLLEVKRVTERKARKGRKKT